MKLSSLCGILLFVAPVASAQTLTHVRVETDQAPEIAELLERAGFDVLEGSVGLDALELVVSPMEQRLLELRGFEPRILAVGRPFYEIQRERRAQAGPEAPVPPGYSDLADVYTRMNALAAAAPSICEVVDLTARYAGVGGVGPTWEGRSLFACKISDNVGAEEDEPAMLVVSNHHAREIVTPEIALVAIENLTVAYFDTNHPDHAAVVAAVDGYEIWIAPVWNPDGYNEVFVGDNLWRKNRRVFPGGTGVDLNRNYPVGWASSCGGSTNVNSQTYRGPSEGSEAETQTMLALQGDRRFAKIVDYHSSGREVLWSYGTCWNHPLNSFLQSEAIALSSASGYGGSNRRPSANGEEYEYAYTKFGTHAFLIETHSQFQPSYASAVAEANQLWPGILWLLARPLSVSGHVTDACNGQPLEGVEVSFGLNFQQGETNTSGGAFGRYQMTLPAGSYTASFSKPGYATSQVPITVGSATAQVLDVALLPTGAVSYCTAKPNSCGSTPVISSFGTPSASASSGFFLEGSNARQGKFGLLIYTDAGRRVPAAPFGNGGFLCLNSPVRRAVAVQEVNGTPGQCNGVFALDMNAFAAGQAGGNPQPFLSVPGTVVDCQWWGRDTVAHGEYLTEAHEYAICP